ncbi:TraY domain-containing protein [Vibrio mediterranei]|uniref:TraY domain-containing protein n=1 Tax=Vibrio mediterranei TaxID=689 RepID=UPI001EFEC7E0|nr:TraY domain-containing protein [Vibrio mediterranei]MCG9660103.1 TraY domain-containing protein [Vibrio mediterranei]
MPKGTSVNVVLDEKHNKLLNRSKTASQRSKRKEASRRLSDHLMRFGVDWEKNIADSDQHKA